MKSQFSKKLFIVLLIFISSLSTFNVSAQYYDWARAEGFVWRGNYGSFVGTDFQGNGVFIGNRSYCTVCIENYVKVFNSSGQEIWGVSFSNSLGVFAPNIISVASDFQKNRYVLFSNPSMMNPVTFGTYSTSQPYFMVKFDSAGTAKRLINLPELFFKIVADSSGNVFMTSGNRSRRYNVFGVMLWENTTFNATDIQIDRYKNCYLSNDVSYAKFTPAGNFIFQKSFGGRVNVDREGRTFAQDATGLRKFTKTGTLQWHRSNLTNPFQINGNGNIYIFSADSIFKYNQTATTIQWRFEKLKDGIVNSAGEIYIGGDYNAVTDEIQPCPFRIPTQGPLNQTNSNQVWIGKISDKLPIPFQAAVYTNQIGDPVHVCAGENINNYTSQGLFSYCTNSSSSFDVNNQFTVELSDSTGNFANAINLGQTSNAVIPKTVSYGTKYRMQVVSSTPGVTYHPNLPSLDDEDITVIPGKAILSLAGTYSFCEGQTFNLFLNGDPNFDNISWYNNGDLLNTAPMTNPVILDSSGIYYAVVSTYTCQSISDSLNLIERPRPNPVVTPTGPISICQGDSVVLTVNDIDLSTIRWRNNNVNIPGQTSQNYSATSAGSYTARVFNIYACARNSDPVDVFVTCREMSNENNSLISVYPNPINDVLHINGFNSLSGLTKISVLDIAGKLVFEKDLNISTESTIELNLEKLNPGIYFLKIINGETVTINKFEKLSN